MRVTPQPQTGSVNQGLSQGAPSQAAGTGDAPPAGPRTVIRPSPFAAVPAEPLPSAGNPSELQQASPPELDTTTSGTVADNLTAQILRVHSGAATMSAAIDDVTAVVGGTGVDLYSNANNLLTDIGTGVSVQDGLNTLATLVVGNSNFSSSLTTQAQSLSNNLDNSLSSLPAAATYGTVSSVDSDGSGGVNMGIYSGFGAANGTYNLQSSDIASGINSGNAFTLTSGVNSLVLVNQSGGALNSQAQVIRYLSSMYPAGSMLATAVSDKVNALKTQLGGFGSTRARIAAVDATCLNTPTGVISTDLATARGDLVNSPGTTLESDVQTLNAMLNGISAGSTVQTRIGFPMVNASASNVATVVGGSGSDVGSLLGDPVGGTSGLAGLIAAQNTTNSNGVWSGSNVGQFADAMTLYDQLNAFLGLFNTNTWNNTSDTTITFDVSGGAPATLQDLIGMASGTS